MGGTRRTRSVERKDVETRTPKEPNLKAKRETSIPKANGGKKSGRPAKSARGSTEQRIKRATTPQRPMSKGSTETQEGKDARIQECQHYVESLVSRLMRSMRLPTQLKEEFVASGMLGLVEAADRFRPEKGANFKAFAFFRIRGAVIDYVRSTCELHGSAYRMFKAFEASQDLLSERFETTGSRVHLDRKEKLVRAVDFMSKSAVALKLIRLKDSERDETDLQVRQSDPENVLALKREQEKLKRCIDSLPAKERLIVEQHYFQDKRLSDVAKENAGLSKSWVSRLHERAVSLLRDSYVNMSTQADLER
jgi:RNA polymerase sigma factor for flagellar operon FliA